MAAKRTQRRSEPRATRNRRKGEGTRCGSTGKATTARHSDGRFKKGGPGGPGRSPGSRNFKSRLLDAVRAYEEQQDIDLFADIVRRARWDKDLLALLINKTIPTPKPNQVEGEDLMAVVEMLTAIEDAMASSRRKFGDIEEALDEMRTAVMGLKRIACKALGISLEQRVKIKWVSTKGAPSNGNGNGKARGRLRTARSTGD